MDRPLPGVRTVRHRAEHAPHGRADATPHFATPEQHVRIGYRWRKHWMRWRGSMAPRCGLCHMGWGGLLFAKDVLPQTPLLAYCEYYHRPEGGDAGFDPADTVTRDDRQRLRLRNSAQLLTLDAMDGGISPTRWQKGRFPAAYQNRIAQCHDGIDVRLCRPDPQARLTLPDGTVLRAGDPVVTYAARDLEPYRGFPEFMRAAARVAQAHPDVRFVVAGETASANGRPPAHGRNWREVMMAETGLDPARITFLGTIPHAALIRLFQISARPRLSHLSLRAVVVRARSHGVRRARHRLGDAAGREVIEDGTNGLITPSLTLTPWPHACARRWTAGPPSPRSARVPGAPLPSALRSTPASDAAGPDRQPHRPAARSATHRHGAA